MMAEASGMLHATLDVGLDGYRLHDDAEIFYVPGFIRLSEAERCCERLRFECDWQQLPLTMFGRTVMSPRLVAWYGDPGVTYRYSGQQHCAEGWTPTLQMLRRRVERRIDLRFNSVLANLYRNGADSMGWHADNEPELGARPVIASLCFGRARRFQLRRRVDHGSRLGVVLEPGSLLVMSGDSQRDWQHCVPKMRGVADTRINLTFRRVMSPEAVRAC
jgi:alkylated DNA repair dioxygenase AlkB